MHVFQRFLAYFFYTILYLGLSLRYRICVKKLNSSPSSQGILFLANHPAEIDPCVLVRVLWPTFHVRPIAIEYLFEVPVVGYLLRLLRALPVPTFSRSSNSFKRHEIEKTYQEIFAALDRGENILIYPAGGLKVGPEEVLGAASGVHTILQKRPHTQIALVRTTGLWGSAFSKAFTGKTPELGKTFLKGFKTLLKNGIFFAPRRKVSVECLFNPLDFPRTGGRLEINRYLEKWYNQEGPEPLKLVPYYFWSQEVPTFSEREKEKEISWTGASLEVQQKVIEEIQKLSKGEGAITADSHLALDLGLDSLDIAQIGAFLKEDFGVIGVPIGEIETVGHVIAYAAKLVQGESEEDDFALFEEIPEKHRPKARYPHGRNVVDVFFKTAARMGNTCACIDSVAGSMTYRKFKYAVLLLAARIAKLPGKRIGILLPASAVVNILVLATLLAKKTPVMINWTLGERTLKSILEQAQMEHTLTSLKFLHRLENVELNGFDEQFVMLEELKKSFSLKEKFLAAARFALGRQYIMKRFGMDKVKKDDPAVLLFTSGTESFPKGVPLSHGNLMNNHKNALKLVPITEQDILLGVLPPFHSFGFSVTGLLPILTGIKAVYSPNPLDGRRMAMTIEKWGVTILCMAPSFLKNLLRVAQKEQLQTVRLVVVGAEKPPPELFEKLRSLNPQAQLVEGYGITECSPILTLNPPEKPKMGSVGVPLPGIEIRIVHPETLKPVALGEAGLIVARGPSIFAGYLDPHVRKPFIELEGQFWYDTGDLGFLDAEGYLFLSGRLKRFVKIGGEMISLTSIEEVLLEAGAKKRWPLQPEAPSLAIIAFEGEGKKTELSLVTTFPLSVEVVNQILKESGMSNLIRIRSVKQVNHIPLLGTGKIDYQKLKGKDGIAP